MTTNEDVLLREVDEDLAQERQLAALRRYGPYLVIALLAALGLVAYLQIRQAGIAADRAEASAAYESALGEDAAADALFQYASSVPAEGYRALALMRAAGTAARSGDRARAVEAYGTIYENDDLPIALRDLARIRAGYLALDDGGRIASEIAQAVTTPAFRGHALEIAGLASLIDGDYASAIAAFEEASGLQGVVAGRANSLLALARTGQAGIALEASESDEDFIEAFGRALSEGRADAPAAADEDAPAADETPVDAPAADTEEPGE